MITGKEMEKLKIIPPDAQIYAQVKASWDKIAKPLDGLGQFETMFAQIGAITGSSSLSVEKKVSSPYAQTTVLSQKGSVSPDRK